MNLIKDDVTIYIQNQLGRVRAFHSQMVKCFTIARSLDRALDVNALFLRFFRAEFSWIQIMRHYWHKYYRWQNLIFRRKPSPVSTSIRFFLCYCGHGWCFLKVLAIVWVLILYLLIYRYFFFFRFLIIILFDCFTFIVKETICTSLVFKKHFLIFDYSVYMSCQPSALNQSNVSIWLTLLCYRGWDVAATSMRWDLFRSYKNWGKWLQKGCETSTPAGALVMMSFTLM